MEVEQIQGQSTSELYNEILLKTNKQASKQLESNNNKKQPEIIN